jgi:hypothetical protein
MPGLQWLKNDTIIRNDDPDVDSKTSPTFPADEEYISFFEENVSKSNEYAETVAGIQSFLKQARVLSRCLNTYVEKISDSALPLVDIKPVLESLFETHDRMKKAEPGALIPDSFRSKVTEVIANVNSKFPGTCTDEKQQDTFKPTSHVQPYSTLVLADLIYARGAQDEGIAVLAEWLTKHKDIKCQSGQKKDKSLSCWWALRVESRIHLWMADVAGQNNVAYRTFINSYNEDLKEYFGKIDKKSEPTSASPRPHRVVSLDGLHAKCKMWEENRPNRKTKKESLSNSVGWRGASFAIAHDSVPTIDRIPMINKMINNKTNKMSRRNKKRTFCYSKPKTSHCGRNSISLGKKAPSMSLKIFIAEPLFFPPLVRNACQPLILT